MGTAVDEQLVAFTCHVQTKGERARISPHWQTPANTAYGDTWYIEPRHQSRSCTIDKINIRVSHGKTSMRNTSLFLVALINDIASACVCERVFVSFLRVSVLLCGRASDGPSIRPLVHATNWLSDSISLCYFPLRLQSLMQESVINITRERHNGKNVAPVFVARS